MNNCSLIDSLSKYIGQTVTIFTTSGGNSGEGFTGVLASVNDCTVKLITDLGAAPSCPLGSSCSRNGWGGYGWVNNNWNNNQGGNRCCCGSNNNVGSVTEIPICKIAGFTHNAI